MTFRKLRRVFVQAILAATVLSGMGRWARADDVEIRFQESYSGPHPNEFADLLGQVKVIVPGALAYITGQWGLPNTLHHPLIVTVTDSNSPISGKPVSAYVRSNGQGDGLRQWLIVDIEHHMLYPGENLEGILYHEMAHAILRDAVTHPQDAGIPTWFNEGLAQSITTEGTSRTQEDFKRYGHSDARAVLCDLNGTVDEFLHGEYNFGCYTQFYLAVKRLIQRGGKDTLTSVIAGLHNGVPLPLVIAGVTRLDWSAFQRDVAQYTSDVFAGNQPIP